MTFICFLHEGHKRQGHEVMTFICYLHEGQRNMAFFLLFGFDEKTLMAPQSLSNLFASTIYFAQLW